MSVRLDGTVIRLEGECRVEDSEPLLALLQGGTGRVVDLTMADSLHAAVVQALLALRPRLVGTPRDAFTARWLAPLLASWDVG